MDRNCIDRNCLDNNEKLKIKEDAMRDGTENNSVVNEVPDSMAENFIKDKSKEKDMKNLNSAMIVRKLFELIRELLKIGGNLNKPDYLNLLTPEYIEQNYNISKRTQARYRNSGSLGYIKVSTNIYYTQDDIVNFFKSCHVSTTATQNQASIKQGRKKDTLNQSLEKEIATKQSTQEPSSKIDQEKETTQVAKTETKIERQNSIEPNMQDSNHSDTIQTDTNSNIITDIAVNTAINSEKDSLIFKESIKPALQNNPELFNAIYNSEENKSSSENKESKDYQVWVDSSIKAVDEISNINSHEDKLHQLDINTLAKAHTQTLILNTSNANLDNNTNKIGLGAENIEDRQTDTINPVMLQLNSENASKEGINIPRVIKRDRPIARRDMENVVKS